MKALRLLTLSLALLPACATSVVGLSRDASYTMDATADGTQDTASDSAQDTAPESAPNCDQDGDGFLSLACGGNDCDDTRASVNPGRSAADDTGTCDGLDNDCNPATSELGVPCPGGGVCAPGGVCASAASIQQLATRGGHTCALHRDGTVLCWGDNRWGQLGDGSTTERHSPVVVPGLTHVVELATGDDFRLGSHTCARLSDGTVRCWGANGNGQLGDGTTAERHSPVVVSGLTGVAGLATGGGYTCARLNDGTVRCWGMNRYGELGDGTTTERHGPVAVPGLANVVELATGYDAIFEEGGHTCARLSDGSVQCWGANAAGQLGDGTTAERHSPVVVPGLTNVVGLAAGGARTCARRSDRTVRCWGSNRQGELGDGSTTERHSPVVVPGLTNVAELATGDDDGFGGPHLRAIEHGEGAVLGRQQLRSARRRHDQCEIRPLPRDKPHQRGRARGGTAHTCARRSDGTVLCWGDNSAGQFGDGSTTSRFTPTLVPGL